VARGSGTLILGNGDVLTREEALAKVSETGVDGVLIGRASLGNPWVFGGREAGMSERISVALEHARYFVIGRGEREFKAVRKHMVGYLRGFPDAAALRMRALNTQSLPELAQILGQAL
jgi:tRNA-dihydrouridine synthase